MNHKSQIEAYYESLKNKQIAKNEDYGDSAFEDVTVAGVKIPALHACLSRMSDKLKRLQSQDLMVDESFEDTLDDLVGYIVIYKILKAKQK
tara:strand:- start:941 stop:1213 length:273 start_codon:yes stop_codon:yes gene_type:complete